MRASPYSRALQVSRSNHETNLLRAYNNEKMDKKKKKKRRTTPERVNNRSMYRLKLAFPFADFLNIQHSRFQFVRCVVTEL